MAEYSSNPGHIPVYASDLSAALRAGRYMYINRGMGPCIVMDTSSAAAIPALYTAGAAQVDTLTIPGALGNRHIEIYQSTAQTLPWHVEAASPEKGYLMGGDVVNNECVEYVPGGNTAVNPLGYTAGTDPGVFIRATFEFADTSGTDQFIVGYRIQEAYAVPTSFLSAADAGYTDFYGVGFSGTAAANLVKTMSDLNNGGSTTVFSTAFAWADTKIHTLEIRLKGRVPRVFINGASAGSTISKDGIGAALTAQATLTPPLYTFDSGDFLIPFIFHRYDATTPGKVWLRNLTCGRLVEDGLQPELRGAQ